MTPLNKILGTTTDCYPIINQAFLSRDEYEHLDECYLKF